MVKPVNSKKGALHVSIEPALSDRIRLICERMGATHFRRDDKRATPGKQSTIGEIKLLNPHRVWPATPYSRDRFNIRTRFIMKSIATPLMLTMAGLITSCGGGGSADSSSSSAPQFKTYEAIYIHASWGGGATGPPINSKGIVPPNFTRSYCPPNLLDLQNHNQVYASLFGDTSSDLVFANRCSAPIDLLVCASAGSGSPPSAFPICNIDPRTTPMSRLKIINLGAAGNGTRSAFWETSPLSLDLNIFYCGVGDTGTAGLIPGANPTDCLAR